MQIEPLHIATHPSLHDTHDTVYSAARMEFDKDSFISFLSISPSQRFMDPTPLAADPGTPSFSRRYATFTG